jgi:hypothetical protein
MNKYYPVIARAVERLDRSTCDTRRAVYERAREAVVQLRSNQPALLEADISKERLALEEAILKVEAEAAFCLASETGAKPRSAASAGGMSYSDKIQSRDHAQSVSPNRDDRPQALSKAPIFLPSASNDHDTADIQTVAIGEAYGADHYYDDVLASRWRGGFLIIMAVLALAALAGTFAYRGPFGGYMFAVLPPILKAETGPDNMLRNDSARRSDSSQTSTTSPGSSEKLTQIEIREARKTPRIISAIPISSKPSAGEVAPAPAALGPAMAADLDQHVAASVSPPSSAPVPAPASAEPTGTAAAAPAAREQAASSPALAPPLLTAASVPPPASAPVPVPAPSEPNETAALAPAALIAASVPPPASAPVPVPTSSEPTDTAAAPAASTPALSPPLLTAESASAPVPVPASSEPTETAAATPAAPTPAPVLTATVVSPPASDPVPVPASAEPNETAIPASSEPTETAASAPAAGAPALGSPSPTAAPPVGTAPSPSPGSPMQAGTEIAAEVSSGGAYAIQLASERSAAEANASFRALRAKFPNQLGGREPIVRRADLGAKGIYYRVMLGPFASMEKAAGMCGRLKTAGCKCLVQRN